MGWDAYCRFPSIHTVKTAIIQEKEDMTVSELVGNKTMG
jgi:hypothetical protein